MLYGSVSVSYAYNIQIFETQNDIDYLGLYRIELPTALSI